MMKETVPDQHEIYSFDVYPSEPLDIEEFDQDNHQLGSYIPSEDHANAAEATDPSLSDLDKVFTFDHDFASIANMLTKHKLNFIQLFDSAIDYYIDGEWYAAFENLSKAQLQPGCNRDGPTVFLLEYLEKHKNLKPEGWENARYIDEVAKPPDTNFDAADDSMDDEGLG